MTEQNLDGAQIGACFEQVGRPAVAQRVWRHVLGDAGMARRFGAGVPYGFIGDRSLLAALLRGEYTFEVFSSASIPGVFQATRG